MSATLGTKQTTAVLEEVLAAFLLPSSDGEHTPKRRTGGLLMLCK